MQISVLMSVRSTIRKYRKSIWIADLSLLDDEITVMAHSNCDKICQELDSAGIPYIYMDENTIKIT